MKYMEIKEIVCTGILCCLKPEKNVDLQFRLDQILC